MAASNLKDLFSLENDINNIGNAYDESFPSKRAKNVKHLEDEFDVEKYSFEELWDSSQYDEEHSIETFIEKANNFF